MRGKSAENPRAQHATRSARVLTGTTGSVMVIAGNASTAALGSAIKAVPPTTVIRLWRLASDDYSLQV